MIVHLNLPQLLGLRLTVYCLGMLTVIGLATAAARGDRERRAAWRRHLADIDETIGGPR